MERRLGNRRTQWERRRSTRPVALAEMPRVLLIQPDQDTRLLYSCLFEAAGYAVFAIADAVMALDVARGRLPDVVVMELSGPDAEGFEILRQWQEDPLTSSIPVVLMTSVLHFDVPGRARASGAISVIGTSAPPEILLAEVDTLVRATPRDRLIMRQLRRSLFMLRELGKRVTPEDHAQERVRSLIDRLQVAILALDTQGHYVAISQGASALTGYSRTELIGRSIFDAGLGLNLSVSERWQEFLAQQPSAAEIFTRDRSGNVLSCQTEIATILPGLHAAAFAA